MVNGNPERKDSVTLDYTYAAALDQSVPRTFWVITAIHSYITFGTDSTRDFGEALPPKVPLYYVFGKPF